MNRTLPWVITSVILACVHLAEAQQAKTAKIGWLAATFRASDSGREFFGRELRALGYVEGNNIAFEYRYAEDKLERLPGLADELVRLKVNVLVAPATSAALAAKTATRAIPIIFLNVTDPVAVDLVDSLARPGGNVTGFTCIASVLAGKRLELLKETVPKLSRVAVLWDPQNPGSAQQWKESQLSARELGLQLYSMEVTSAERYESAFKEAIKAGSTALAITQHALVNSYLKRIADLTAKNRLPTIYSRRDFVDNGGLMSYGPDRAEPYRRVALYVDRILKGARPAELPVEQPTKFELLINLKTAKALDLTIPASVLARTDRVIK